MQKKEVFFSYYQKRSGFFRNLNRKITLNSILARSMKKAEIEGGTFSTATGFWLGDREPSVQGIFYGVSTRKLEKLAEILKVELEQDSVLVEGKFI